VTTEPTGFTKFIGLSDATSPIDLIGHNDPAELTNPLNSLIPPIPLTPLDPLETLDPLKTLDPLQTLNPLIPIV